MLREESTAFTTEMLFYAVLSFCLSGGNGNKKQRSKERQMDQRFFDTVESSPIIAAVKDKKGLDQCCSLPDIKIIFILYGDICNIEDIVNQIRSAGKMAIVHVDLVAGLASKEIAVDFIQKYTGADGIISTKPGMIKRARELNMHTVMRFWMLDSLSLETVEKQLVLVKPDFIEILPGVMPKIIRHISSKIRIPVIAGGLIQDKEDVVAALNAGAISVSTTNPNVWRM